MPRTKKPEPATLHDALRIAQETIGSIQKDGRNDHQHYDYVSAENMIGQGRKVLLDVGIVMSAGNVECIPFASGDHGDAVIVRQSMVLTFTGGERTEDALNQQITLTRDWPAVPQKGRPLDKAVASALTAGLSYTLRDLLLVPRGDEPGVGMDHSRNDGQVAQATTSQPDHSARVGPKAQTPPARAGGKPACPACGSKVWDNRDSATGSQPVWSCSNKGECPGGKGNFSWASWDPNEFGTEDEAPPAAFEDGLDERGEAETNEPIPF